MFKTTRKRIHDTITNLKAAFALFVASVEKLTLAVEANSIKVASLEAEQKELRSKFDVLVGHTHYLARAKKNELERSGHRVE